MSMKAYEHGRCDPLRTYRRSAPPSRRTGDSFVMSGSTSGRLNRWLTVWHVSCPMGSNILPGGLIHRTRFWLVEHCIGPLGLGTLVVKPERHVTSVGEFSEDEAAELGPLASACIKCGERACQGRSGLQLPLLRRRCAVHIHYVVQPVTKNQMSDFGAYGPNLQAAMFSAGEPPELAEVERIATIAQRRFTE